MAEATPISMARGDGIGPEIMDVTLEILEAAGADLDIEEIEIGEKVYKAGHTAGITEQAWDSLRRTKVFLKAPITTPRGGGYKSLNVTVRKTLGLFANVRPCVSYYPFIETHHPHMDVVIIRENEEDLYAGIEHRQTRQVTQCLKLITRPGSEKIIRYAFAYARRNNRKRITAMVKDNIMKITDGMFVRLFHEIAEEYPDIEADTMIVDIGAARLADTPDRFDVIVTPNLYGDILSDIAAQVSGSIGLGPSANIGEKVSMFEAIHGSAPDIAGQNIANPSGLILAAVMMLRHIGQGDVAERIHNAWLVTIEEGIHKHDIYREGVSRERVGTKQFGRAVIGHLGKTPKILPGRDYSKSAGSAFKMPERTRREPEQKDLVGVDVFIDDPDTTPDELAGRLLQHVQSETLRLKMITNRGVKVWPEGMPETFSTDHWRCRFQQPEGRTVTHKDILEILSNCEEAGIDFIKTEGLYTFNGEPGYSLGQGQ
ncbi:NADP-dependent isocitrate dehydrogenase [bacterium]|nr:NADP-dependent isocitrate dehydrogenase [bacterium]